MKSKERLQKHKYRPKVLFKFYLASLLIYIVKLKLNEGKSYFIAWLCRINFMQQEKIVEIDNWKNRTAREPNRLDF